MMTKIFVCSNSSIDYINHSENIKSIPTIIKFSDDEEYKDYIDISASQFYNRLKITDEKHVSIEYQKHNVINEYLVEAKESGYTQFLFLIPSMSFSNLAIPVSIVKNENIDLAITVYETGTVCYPLAYMALAADKLLNEDNLSMEDTLMALDKIRNNHHIFFFDPAYLEESKKFITKYKKGMAYSLENGLISKINKTSSQTRFDEIINILKAETTDCEVIWFICYSDKQSKYINIIGEYINQYIEKKAKIKLSPLAPGVGVSIGNDAIALGYIIK